MGLWITLIDNLKSHFLNVDMVGFISLRIPPLIRHSSCENLVHSLEYIALPNTWE